MFTDFTTPAAERRTYAGARADGKVRPTPRVGSLSSAGMPPPHPIVALDTLRARAREASSNARAPYSGRASGAALLLADGRWVPGARVESASYPLTIPALLGAYVGAVAAGRRDVRAVALTEPLQAGELGWLADALGAEPAALALDGAVFGPEPLPSVGDVWPALLDRPAPATDADGLALAREAAARAYVPESDFPVGCVLLTEGGALVPGCNVEHAEWTRGLCAERTALAAAAAYGAGPIRRIFLSCPTEPRGTPCGACRQLLAEYAPGVPVVMDRGDAAPGVTTTDALLPDFFSGDRLRL